MTKAGTSQFAVGLDYGTESVRAILADVCNGRVVATGSHVYSRGVIDERLPGSSELLPADYALQHPQDWLDSAAVACRNAITEAAIEPRKIIGVGVAFTSCTMLPALADGTPLCLVDRFARTPLAWPKLWKHHGAKAETDRINSIACQRAEPWLARYGGSVGIEWFFPKILETLLAAPNVYAAADVWLEAGDWLVWQLTNGLFPSCKPNALFRSTCQAGYKAQWNSTTGYPSREFFAAVDPAMADVVSTKLPGRLAAPGTFAGGLTISAASLLGLIPGTPVGVSIIDAHAGVAGSGVADNGTMVLVMGTSSCHMLNGATERLAAGIAGVVEDGILPGSFGYETGQASVGDAFAWVAKAFSLSHRELNCLAAALPPGSNGVLALDWLNGCRTPLMDARLSGAFVGLTLGTQPEQMYRALMEATAFGVRWIVDTLREANVPVIRFVASGGLPAKSPLLMQIYADVLNAEIRVAESDQSVGLGAAIFGALAAGPAPSGHASVGDAIRAMARQRDDLAYQPSGDAAEKYDTLYGIYRSLAAPQGALAVAMRALREV